MPMKKDEISELKSLIMIARNRPLGFGLCAGKTPENSILILDKVKSPERLRQQAKKAGDTPKLASGMIEVKGRIATLLCEEEPAAGLAKRTKLFLKSIDLKMAVIIADLEGNILEQEIDEEDEIEDPAADDLEDEADSGDTKTGGQDGAAQTPDPNLAKWQAVEAKLSDRIAEAGDAAGLSELLQCLTSAPVGQN